MEGRILISNLHDTDNVVKQRAIAYFRSAKEAEEAISRYEGVKYAVDLNLQQKQIAYDNMITCLTKTREKES